MNPIQSLKDFMESSRRVLVIAKKPDWKEYSAMIKVTGLGIAIIAVIGYIVLLIFTIAGV